MARTSSGAARSALVCALWLVAARTGAQDAEPLGPEAGSESGSESVTDSGSDLESGPESGVEGETAVPADRKAYDDGPVLELLPPSAYPEPRVRGIRGGSLWMTFHGLQWPYYPKTGVGVSGLVWIDTGYERIERGRPGAQSVKAWLQQGRLLLRATPTFTRGDFFVQGQAELVANKDQSQRQPDIVDADDVWVRTGLWNTIDVQLGRFEAWEVYHFGMGLDLNTMERDGATDDMFGVPQIYGVTYAFYRPQGVGQAAVHIYATDFLRFELGSQLGSEFGSNALAGRPVAVLDLGWLKLKGGVEYKKLTDQKDGLQGETTQRGGGGALQLVFDPYVELGFNGALGLVDRIASDGSTDEKGSTTAYSLGGFANGRIVEDLLIGAGVNMTKLHDIHYDDMIGDNGQFSHLQAFVALQYLAADTLYIKLVGAYAKGDFHPTFGEPVFDNSMYSVRLRLQLPF